MRLVRPSLTLVLLLPAVAVGQNVPTVSVGAGFTFPTGDAADSFRRGINFGAQTTFPLSPRLSVQGAVDYRKLGRDDDAVLARQGRNAENFRLGGGFFDGGHRWTLAALANLQLRLAPPDAIVAPYAFAGGGFAAAGIADLDTYFLGDSETEVGESENVPAADVGGGIELRLSQGVWLFGQAAYVMFFTGDTSTSMVPIKAGLSLHLGGS